MEKPIITIGREYGAGGHTVAKALSQQLGIPAYDKEIIKITAEESGLTESILQRTEESDGLGNLISWFLPSGGLSSYDRAILAQAQVIRNLAAQGPCIIVGRGADYILRDLPQVINVFLYADPADKLQRHGHLWRHPGAGGPPGAPLGRSPGVLLPLPHQEKVGGPKKLPSHPEHQPCGQTGLCRTHPSVRPPGYGSGEGDPVKNSQPQHPNRCCGCLFL